MRAHISPTGIFNSSAIAWRKIGSTTPGRSGMIPRLPTVRRSISASRKSDLRVLDGLLVYPGELVDRLDHRAEGPPVLGLDVRDLVLGEHRGLVLVDDAVGELPAL